MAERKGQGMNYAEEIKSRVTPKQLFSHYGFPPDRSGFVKCPLHGERTASLKVYDDGRGWCCHGCHKGGDVINFVREYFGLDFRDACTKINEDFRLGLPIGQKMSLRQMRNIQSEENRRKLAHESWKDEHERLRLEYESLFAEWIRLDTNKSEYAPHSPADGFHPLFVESLQKIDGVEYALRISEMRLEEHGNKRPNYCHD